MEKQSIIAAAAVRLTVRFPFWTEVLYSMQIKEAVPGDGVMTEATDGRQLIINTDFFNSIPLDQQTAELVHELGHKIFLHPTRRGNRDPKLWNIACDYAINSMMKVNGFNIPSDWLLDMQYEGWLAEAIYADLLKKQKENPGKGRPQLADGRADLKEPSGTPEEIEKMETQIKALVEHALATAKAMGTVPVGLSQTLDGAYKPSKEPWYNHLHRYMQSLSLGEYNWAKLNRRTLRTHGYFSPHHLSEALGDIAVFIDTSGSCYDAAQQANFAGHLNAILAEAKPRRVMVYYFDAAVYPGETIEAGALEFESKPKGGGGTRFEPIFEQLERDGVEPEVCLILTDLMGSFPNGSPEYPVIWVDIENGPEAPFGETIHVGD